MVRKAILCFSDIIKHAEVDIAMLYLSKITANLEYVSHLANKLGVGHPTIRADQNSTELLQ
jgi:hypothetical protein